MSVTLEMGLVLAILAGAFVLLISEKVRMDVVALLVLGTLALTGLVDPAQALSGFSSPAVITVWAVFILSGGLTRTGVANFIGRQVLRVAGNGEARLIAAIMLTAGLMSSVLNNVGVAALLLPVVMDVARRTGRNPSRLLMPLAFGALLGGLTTLIGTPPNILVNDVLSDFGLARFEFFDYTPVGVAALLSGVAFMVLVGRHLLPERDITKEVARMDLGQIFAFQERITIVRMPDNSPLAGQTLAASRLGAALGLNVLAIVRPRDRRLAPGPSTTLLGSDQLIVEGQLDRLAQLQALDSLKLEDAQADLNELVSGEAEFAEVRIVPGSSLVGQTLAQIGFRNQFGVNILAIWHDGQLPRSDLQERPLQPSDALLIHASRIQLDFLSGVPDFETVRPLTPANVEEKYQIRDNLLTLAISLQSNLAGRSLAESRLGDAFGLSVLGITRNGKTHLAPHPEEHFEAGDKLLVEGRTEDLEILRGLRELVVDRDTPVDLTQLESDLVGLAGVVLSPQSTHDGKTLRDLHFREKYGLSVLAIWRGGTSYRADLRDIPLRFGDALLLYGSREKLKILGGEPDFLVLTEAAQEPPRLGKAPIAAVVMLAVVTPVILGWVSIAIAAVVGATVMVLAGCLTMDEAYRDIEWRAVFLIAGMLPLGIAMQQTGTAEFLAGRMVGLVGGLGTVAVVAGVFLLTVLSSQVLPTAAVAVLMAPIAISTAGELGISAHSITMAVAIASSTCFLSPVAHPANSLVTGPGGYRFSDFLKVGLPMTLVVLVVVLAVLPIFWPY
ncbi:MAG: SLC13 family permease [Chloroflexota bacterium]